MDAALRRLMREMLDAMDTATDGLLGGQLTPAQWHNEVVGILGDHHTAAYMLGRGSDDLSREGRELILRLVAAQVGYLEGFTDDIEAGRYDGKDEGLRARARLYAESIKGTWSRSATWGWDLPVHPTDDCQGRIHCQCSWEVQVLDGEGNADAYWRLGEAEHCGACLSHAAEYSPLRIRGGKRV